MNTKRITLAIAAFGLLSASCSLIFRSTIPNVGPPPAIKVQASPDQLERGRYLARHVTGCIDCHSERDFHRYSGPVVPGTEGKGGFVFGKEMGLPGTIPASNITPAALGKWSDGEIARAITSGVTRSNEALFPIMPYPRYNAMDASDLHAIIVYVRSLKPIDNKVPSRQLDFPLNHVVKTLPRPAAPQPRPDAKESVALGRYLVNIAACSDCHTPTKKGTPIAGKEFAGGGEFVLPWGRVRPTNITPDPETGIGQWSRERFIGRFKEFDPSNGRVIAVKDGEFNTIMPWSEYSGMTEADLGAIYDYLKTLKPISNTVVLFTPAGASQDHDSNRRP
ncbi:MAG: cytochrome c [Nitrospirae bacterium]|nr:cytochrome c [Nitrospirota bacterium]